MYSIKSKEGNDQATPDMRVFDAHLHIIEPGFPLVENNGFLPSHYSCADYLQRMQGTNLVGGTVVSGSFQGCDQRYLRHALSVLGPRYVGVTQIADDISEQEIMQLDAAGVRAIRFNLKRGDVTAASQIDRTARWVHELVGWHAELYVDASALESLFTTLSRLPAVSIDHLGLSRHGFDQVLRLAECGARVKATGFGRGDLDVPAAIRQLYDANPDCLMFGTDLPSTRATRAYHDGDLNLIGDVLGEDAAQKVLCDNAMRFYRLG